MKHHFAWKILLLCLIFLHFSCATGFSEHIFASLLSFEIAGQVGSTIIDNETLTITIFMPHGTDVTNLAPEVSLAEGAMINPASGRPMDFSNGQNYVLILPTGEYEVYRVIVKEAPLEAAPETTLIVGPQYDGVWISAADYGFSLYLPEGWNILPSEEENLALAITDPTATYSLIVEQLAGEGFSIDEMYEVFSQADGFDNVQKLIINGYSVIHYRAPAQNMRAFATHLWDPAHVYFFKFTPADDVTFTRYAEEIMSTLSPAI